MTSKKDSNAEKEEREFKDFPKKFLKRKVGNILILSRLEERTKTFQIMKMLTLFSFFSTLFLLVSCGAKETRTVEPGNSVTQQNFQVPDQAFQNWLRAWNSSDPSQIKALTADDVVVVLNGNEIPQESISKFIEGSGAAIRDLQLNSIKKGSSETMAYDTGTFTHKNANNTNNYKGSYTFVWERSVDDNEWKVKAINISNAQPEIQ